MAVVADEYTRWQGGTGQPTDSGRLLVWHENTGQRLIDRVEIDNTNCTDRVRVQVYSDAGVLMFEQTVEPGFAYTDTQARGERWNRNTANKVGQWDVRVTAWTP